jgi:multidrug efflux system outer membrane protein
MWVTYNMGLGCRPIGWRWILLAFLTILGAGCALKRDQYGTPTVPMPDQYVAATAAAAKVEDSSVPRDSELANWWRLFGSKELDDLIDRALANNQDLRIAAQKVFQAKARAIQGKAGQLPEVSLPVQFQGEAPQDGIGSVEKEGQVESETTYQVGLNVDWRVDLWGERSSLAESAELQLWRAIFEHDDQARKLVAELVGAYVEYLSLNDRMRVARETEVVMSNMLQGMEIRLESGDATLIDVEQQRTAVFSVRSDMPEIELRRKQIANRLALLLGGVPEGVVLSDTGLEGLLYPSVKPGVPTALLLQRPDVRAIEARLLAADANVDVARARVMPPLDLTAQVGYGSLYIDEIFMPHTLYWNFISNLSATIFDAGRLKSFT